MCNAAIRFSNADGPDILVLVVDGAWDDVRITELLKRVGYWMEDKPFCIDMY